MCPEILVENNTMVVVAAGKKASNITEEYSK